MENSVQVAQPKPTSQVEQTIDRMDQEINRFENVRDELFNRLINILKPEEPCETKERSRSDSDMVPLATKMDNMIYALSRITNSVEGMIARIEL